MAKELHDRELRYKYKDFIYKWDRHSIGILKIANDVIVSLQTSV